jgi:hypothetical protein
VYYETCRRILAEELNVEPTTETLALVEQIRADKLDRISEALPVSLSHQDWGEAPNLGSFYGRKGIMHAQKMTLKALGAAEVG